MASDNAPPSTMHLYFVRHGLATWPADQWSGDDAERPLTPAGEQQIEAVGAALASRTLRADLILHSPLRRARQTAEIIARRLKPGPPVREHPALAPGFGLPALHALLKEHARAAALMLVGHNPDMADVVTALIARPARFKEGTVAHVRLKRGEPAAGTLVWLAAAEELASE